MTTPKDREELREQIGDIGLEYGEISQYPWVHDPIMALIDAYTTRAVGEADRKTLETIASLLNGDHNQAEVVKGYVRNKLLVLNGRAALPKDTGEATDEQ